MDNIHENALQKYAEGIRKATSIVSQTMGPKGRNVDIQTKLYPFHMITNDGATILKSIELSDPLESIGLSYLKEAADRSNNNSGDGSTTTSVLLNAILEEGLKAGNSTLEIKESLDECLPLIERSIHEQTRQITVEDIPAVARIAGENEQLASVLGEIYKTIGKEGIIHLEGSGTYDTSFSLIEGVRFVDTGYLSPYMVYDEQAEKDGKKATKAVYKNPQILITKNKIEHLKDIDPILQALVARGDKSLVIFTNDMDSNVARALIELQKTPERSINILIIKAPTLWKSYVFEDFAAITGATIIEDSSGASLGNKFRLDYLGTCGTLICDKEETTVIGIKDITEYTNSLMQEGSSDSKLRLSWLQTKTAILKLGAKSETELSYRRLKAEDAIHSSKLALKHGVVPGGGIALLNAARTLEYPALSIEIGNGKEHKPSVIGINILKKALRSPFKQILFNSGIEVDKALSDSDFDNLVFGKAIDSDLLPKDKGIDARSGEAVNMFDAGIVDAASIVLGAVRNSLGIASTLLTTSSAITLPEEKQAAQASPFPFN